MYEFGDDDNSREEVISRFKYDFDYDNSPLFVLDTDRTLKPILKNNDLLHPLAEDSFFAIIAYGSKTIICRKAKCHASRASRSKAPIHENATVCQGLPY